MKFPFGLIPTIWLAIAWRDGVFFVSAHANAIHGAEGHRRKISTGRTPIIAISTTLSLADRFTEIAPDAAESEFVERLRQEETNAMLLMRQPLNKRSASTDTALVWKSIVAAVLLFGAARFVTGGSATTPAWIVDWRDLRRAAWVVAAANSVSVIEWLRGGTTKSTWSQRLALAGATCSRRDLLLAVWENLLPLAGKTLRQIFVLEIWNRFFGSLTAGLGSIVSKFVYSGGAAGGARELPAWIEQIQSLAKSAVKRVARKVLQRILQQHVEDAAATVVHFGRVAVRDQLLLQVDQFFPVDPR